jgi:putative methionine-R-sulfoxide reductase with GAF domain
MRLQTRLTLLILAIMVPILLITNLFLAARAEANLREQTNAELQQVNNALSVKTEMWYRMNVGVLYQLAAFDQIISMDRAQQKPILEKTSQAFPHLFLVQTTDTTGMNVARNDDEENKDYSDRDWFKIPMSGEVLGSQVLISRTTGQPSLNLSTRVVDADGVIVGVVSVVSDLTDISNEVLEIAQEFEQHNIQTFIVDLTDKIVAHPDPEISSQLADYQAHPAVTALRAGKRGMFEYTDEQGREWLAYLSVLENGWGIITEEERAVALAEVTRFTILSWAVTAAAVVLAVALALWIISRSLRPIGELTATATAIAAGDISREAKVERRDEIGELAAAFNSMTAQLRGLIANLEQRVAERTRVVETTAEVSRRLSMILDLDHLVREVVEQLQKAFNYYHVQIYLFDPARQNLVLVGGTGEAARAMLANEHKIPRGKGLVGRAAERNEPVVVPNTFQDPGWLPNPLLADTRAEVAAPIAIGGEVSGVLDVQHNVVGGLTRSDAELIQQVANQVAIAVQNARAFTQARQQADREALAAAIGQKIQRSMTIDDVLKVAVSELGQALNARHSAVELRARTARGKN